MTIQLTLTPAQNQWLEATWTDVVQAPDVVTPAVPDTVIPATPDELDDDGYLIAEGTPEQIIPGTPEVVTPGQITRTDVKHVSYHPTQLALLQADAAHMGTSLDSYAEMLAEWVADYVPPPPEPTPIPQTLTIRQAKLILLQNNLLDDVDAAVAQADRSTQIEWEYATEVNRTWPTLVTMASALGMTDAQLDQLFIEGAKL